MTTTTTTTTAMAGLIRPWWPGRDGDHINAKCPTLTRETSAPVEGSGWLNPANTTRLCADCFTWNAACRCGASITQECGAGPHSKKQAEIWMNAHFCLPHIDLTPTPRGPATDAPGDNQPALFALEPRR